MRRSLIVLALVATTRLAAAQDESPIPGNDDSRKLRDEAMTKGSAGDFAGAIALFKKAIEADPKNFLAWFDLGGAHEQVHDFDGAIAAYEKTTELAPAFAEAQCQLGTLYLTKKRAPEKAIDRFRIALTTKKPHVDKRFDLKHTRSQSLQNGAVAYAVRGNEGVAVAVAASYLADPDVERDRDPAMKKLVERAGAALAKRTGSSPFAQELGAISKDLHAGKRKEALAAYDAFAKAHAESELSPLDAWNLHEGIGLAHALQGETEPAAAAFRKSVDDALKLGVRVQLESRFNVACCESELDHADKALEALDEVLWTESIARLAPDFANKKTYVEKARADDSLAKARKAPGFEELLAKYAK
jgi:tetratricopeptide (TPR) repeat protein